MSAWNDFNDAEHQQSFDLIPKGTVAKVRMTVKPGGYDDPSQGWVGGHAARAAHRREARRAGKEDRAHRADRKA